MRLPPVMALLGASVLLAGCATKQDVRDLRIDLQGDLDRISARQDSLLAEIRLSTVQTQDTLQSASRELVDIRGTLLRELRMIADDLGRLEEMVGQNQASISTLRDEMARSSTRSLPMNPGRTGGVDRDELLVPGMEGDPDGDYDAAMRLYQMGSLVGARAAFEDFLNRYPRDELAPLVHYNLGDIAVQEDRLDDAIEAFQRVQERFPEEDKVADALYRIGLIHMERDEDDAARRVFERLVNTYEDRDSVFLGDLVQLARERLAELGG